MKVRGSAVIELYFSPPAGEYKEKKKRKEKAQHVSWTLNIPVTASYAHHNSRAPGIHITPQVYVVVFGFKIRTKPKLTKDVECLLLL